MPLVADNVFKDAIPSHLFTDDAAQTDDASDPHGYWVKPDGRVHVGPYGTNGLRRTLRGWKPLSQYGQFKLIAGKGAWDPSADPYLKLVRSGGQHELPAEQAAELGWHRPPRGSDRLSHKLIWEQIRQVEAQGIALDDAIVTVLPQFEATGIPHDYLCAFCPAKRFVSESDLRRHESVSHRDDVRQRELRDSIATALSGASGGSQQQGPLIDLLAEQMAQQSQSNAQMQELISALINRVAASAPDETVTAPPSGKASNK